MNELPRPIARLAHMAVLLLALCVTAASLPAQTVQITSPADGAVVPSGQPLTVTVTVSPAAAFQFVALLLERPLQNDQALTVPPYQFTIQIPPGIPSRRYSLGAIGVTADEQGADFGPITIDIERPDSPQQLEVQPSTLIMSYVGVEGGVEVYGKFSDGSRVDLTYSSKTAYSSDTPAVATVDSNGTVTAVGPGSANIIIANDGASTQVPVTVPLPVRILPGSSSLYPSQTEHFYAHLAMPPGVDTSVTWSLNPPLGSIDSTGLYAPPASISSVQRITLTATSVADPTKTASAQIFLFPPISVTLTPTSVALAASESQQFTAKVAYAALKAVKWSVAPAGMGTIDGAGRYTAPAAIPRGRNVTITATSVADTSKSASAQITLLP